MSAPREHRFLETIDACLVTQQADLAELVEYSRRRRMNMCIQQRDRDNRKVALGYFAKVWDLGGLEITDRNAIHSRDLSRVGDHSRRAVTPDHDRSDQIPRPTQVIIEQADDNRILGSDPDLLFELAQRRFYRPLTVLMPAARQSPLPLVGTHARRSLRQHEAAVAILIGQQCDRYARDLPAVGVGRPSIKAVQVSRDRRAQRIVVTSQCLVSVRVADLALPGGRNRLTGQDPTVSDLFRREKVVVEHLDLALFKLRHTATAKAVRA